MIFDPFFAVNLKSDVLQISIDAVLHRGAYLFDLNCMLRQTITTQTKQQKEDYKINQVCTQEKLRVASS